jgi:hypothetical protein
MGLRAAAKRPLSVASTTAFPLLAKGLNDLHQRSAAPSIFLRAAFLPIGGFRHWLLNLSN